MGVGEAWSAAPTFCWVTGYWSHNALLLGVWPPLVLNVFLPLQQPVDGLECRVKNVGLHCSAGQGTRGSRRLSAAAASPA